MEEKTYGLALVRRILTDEYEEYTQDHPDVTLNEWLLATYGEEIS